jgi:group I intron endonuclease
MANINKSKKYHFIYKTTNLLNGKYYVGMHSTCNLKDGYLGSGKKLTHSIRKYGKDNFRLEILEFFDSREKLVEREESIVNESLLQDPMCMNLRTGGKGGIHQMTDEESKLWHSKGGKTSWILHRDARIERMSNITRDMWKNGKFDNVDFGSWWKGRKHADETKSKIGLANSIHQKGEGNSQYGTMWITNGSENKKVKKNSQIPISWVIGRK